jgi:hypothetical protein
MLSSAGLGGGRAVGFINTRQRRRRKNLPLEVMKAGGGAVPGGSYLRVGGIIDYAVVLSKME